MRAKLLTTLALVAVAALAQEAAQLSKTSAAAREALSLRLAGAATHVVLQGACQLSDVTVAAAGATVTVTFFDSATPQVSGTNLMTFTVRSNSLVSINAQVSAQRGLTITNSAAVTVSCKYAWQP
jgi:hypothetical protein